VRRLAAWLPISRQKYDEWTERYGKANEHNAHIPRDHWLLPEEKQAILDFHHEHPLEGCRRLTFMMLDADLVAVSPTTVYRVLSSAGLLDRWNRSPSKKGTGFEQPLSVHEHWHIDVAHLNLCGTFYYLCSILDGKSRAIVHWEVREQMTERDVECILQRAHEKYPQARPRIISDNGPQFIAADFKDFIRQCGMTHVRTSPYYPQSNGKLERQHRSFKHEALRPGAPQTLAEALALVERFVEHYNRVRLHSALGYVTPQDVLEDKQGAIWAERDRRLEAARELRAQRRAAHRQAAASLQSCHSPPYVIPARLTQADRGGSPKLIAPGSPKLITRPPNAS
jgi:transposase InsO family protein